MGDEIKNTAGSAEYKKRKRYFIRRIKEVSAYKEHLQGELKETREASRQAYKNIGKKSSVLFGNNFYAFIMMAGLILLPFSVIAVLIKLSGGKTAVSLIPMIVAVILIAVCLVFKLVKFKRNVKALSALRGECASAEELLVQQSGAYKFAKKARKKLKRIYKKFKKNPSMSTQEMDKLSAQFEKIYGRINLSAAEE